MVKCIGVQNSYDGLSNFLNFYENKNINDKIDNFSIEDKINQAINKFKEKQDLEYKEEIKIYKKNIHELEEKLKVEDSILTPSSSTEKKGNKKIYKSFCRIVKILIYF